MRPCSLALFVVSCLSFVVSTIVAELAYELKPRDSDETGRDDVAFLLGKESEQPAFPLGATSVGKGLAEDGVATFGDQQGPEKLSKAKRFSGERSGSSSLSGFWKKRALQPSSSFWKRAMESSMSGFWKRQEPTDDKLEALKRGLESASQFWKRGAESPEEAVAAEAAWLAASDSLRGDTSAYSSFHKRGLYQDDGADSFWKRSGSANPWSAGYGSGRYGGGNADSGFWKRGGVPWNLMIPAEYRDALYKAELEQEKETKVKSNVNTRQRRKGPRHSPDFNPTGW